MHCKVEMVRLTGRDKLVYLKIFFSGTDELMPIGPHTMRIWTRLTGVMLMVH